MKKRTHRFDPTVKHVWNASMHVVNYFHGFVLSTIAFYWAQNSLKLWSENLKTQLVFAGFKDFRLFLKAARAKTAPRQPEIAQDSAKTAPGRRKMSQGHGRDRRKMAQDGARQA